jgi:hypothetical protein
MAAPGLPPVRHVSPMANYIPYYGKKLERFNRHERVFLAILRSQNDIELLREAAETVRLAKIRALKARRAQFPPSEKYAIEVAKLEGELAFWFALTDEEVIAGYRSGRLPKMSHR